MAYSRANRLPWKATGYRTDAGAEVDLVIDAGSRLLAIECKLGRTVSTSDLGGLRSFAALARKPFEAHVAYQGERPQRMDAQVEAVSYVEFLLERLPAIAKRG